MDRQSEVYKQADDRIWGRVAKTDFFGRKPSFLGPKKRPLPHSNHVLAPTGQGYANKKIPQSKIKGTYCSEVTQARNDQKQG